MMAIDNTISKILTFPQNLKNIFSINVCEKLENSLCLKVCKVL